LAATITRYEAWPIAAALAASAFFVAWRRPMPNLTALLRRRRAGDRLVVISLLSFAGIAGWFAWCQIIFHNAFYFVNGQFAKPPVGSNPAVGNWWVAIKTYGFAMIDTVGTPILLLSAVGLAVFVARVLTGRQSFTRALPVLALLMVIPFYVLTLEQGERPLDVVQLAGQNYNVRYGLTSVLLAAIFIGYLASTLSWSKLQLTASAAIIGVIFAVNAVTLQQGVGQLVGIEHATTGTAQAAAAFKKYYPGGFVLMQSWGNEALIKDAVPVNMLVDEGSNGLWKPALRSPIHNDISTIVIARSGPDVVRSSVNAGEFSHYQRVWSNSTYAIYEAKTILARGGRPQ